ncbi:MAG: SelB C-terminal domain-containing protein [Myxococcales bacterium]|nr:SelB C-terminal domain-containing protein [Myxococcales bacterium]
MLRLPSHRAALDPADVGLARKLLRAIGRAGLQAQTEAALLERFPDAGPGQVVRVLRHLERVGRVVRTGGLVFPGREARALRRAAAARLVAGETLGVGAFKDAFGLTRKHAIPLLEWLDDEGVARREGQDRVAGPRAAAAAVEEEGDASDD